MKKIWENKTTSFRKANEFDMLFWKRAGVQARFSAAWKMLEEFYKIRNKRGYKLRLQRTVQNIERA
jgi:hypothetical protein